MTANLTPYAGRWVALIGDLVVGVGHTADEALRLAQRNRPKERFKLRFIDSLEGRELLSWTFLDRLRTILSEYSFPVYLVGGTVRDILLGKVSHDLDFVVPHGAIKLAFNIADRLDVPAYKLDQERDTGRVIVASEETTLDFASFRGPDLDADLRDRDFTINAMALPVTASRDTSVIDPCQGRSDLAVQLVRQTHDQAIQDDPIRALRAIRLALELGFSLTPDTTEAVSKAGHQLHEVSVERVRDELLRLLQTSTPFDAINRLAQTALLEACLPEIAALTEVVQSPPHHHAALDHTIATLRWLTLVEAAVTSDGDVGEPAAKVMIATGMREAISAYTTPLAVHLGRKVDGGVDGRTLLRLGALFHDVGKSRTQTIDEDGRLRFPGHESVGAEMTGTRLHRLRLSREAIGHVQRIVAGHMRPLSLVTGAPKPAPDQSLVSRRAIYRFFRDSQSAGLDIGLLALADHLATHEGPGRMDSWERLLNLVTEFFHHYFEQYSTTIAPTPLLDGRDLIGALQLKPGPEIGRLLRLIKEAQAAGEVTTREEALQLARSARQ